jgi:hypothetical protein
MENQQEEIFCTVARVLVLIIIALGMADKIDE